jgi:hypothetical protein
MGDLEIDNMKYEKPEIKEIESIEEDEMSINCQRCGCGD